MQRMKEESVRFASGALTLEGRAVLPPDAVRAAIVCHPHPQYGGDMDNSVVTAVVRTLAERGVATLRFNFRGVGGSEGGYAGGPGETDDARAAVAWLRERSPQATIDLGGYSFGSIVALLAGHDAEAVERLFAIALPVSMFDSAPIVGSGKAKLFVAGDRDPYCPWPALEKTVERCSGENQLTRIAGADHFFFGDEERVAEAVARFVG
jgi:alpha/beta superfamily hydrolase